MKVVWGSSTRGLLTKLGQAGKAETGQCLEDEREEKAAPRRTTFVKVSPKLPHKKKVSRMNVPLPGCAGQCS